MREADIPMMIVRDRMKRCHRLLSIFGLFLFIFCINCQAEETKSSNFDRQRNMMVREQIEKRGIKDERVLAAMRKVERHRFVPSRARHQAYEDFPLPIGEGQTISQPYIVALMTAALNLDESKKVLEVGTGSGYQAAILAELCSEVYTIEINDVLGKRAKDLLSKTGYSDVHIKIGDGYKGWKEFSPFDGIIVTCAPGHIPKQLKEQLAEGGRMVIPVGKRSFQELLVLTKKDGILTKSSIAPVRFVPMLKEDGSTY